jgi:type IV pilus assembly protein PilQ
MKKTTIAMIMCSLLSGQVFANSLENMQVRFLKNNDSLLKFDFEDDSAYVEELSNDNGIVYLKIPKVKSNLSNDYFDIDEGGIKNVKIEDRGNNLHIYVTAEDYLRPVVSKKKDTITLNFENNVASYQDLDKIIEVDNDIFIDDVKFERESDVQSKIVVSHNSDNPIFDITEYDGGALIIFENASIPSRLFKNNEVSSFRTPISKYLTKIENGSFMLDITFNKGYKVDLFNTKDDNKIIFIANGKKSVEIEEDDVVYENDNGLSVPNVTSSVNNEELITFNFQNIEIGKALFVLAQKMGLNLVMDDKIKGTLSLKLKDVPQDQALNVILRTKGLGKYVEGNIMIVAPLEDIVAREQFELSSKKKIKEVKPLVSKEVQVNYAKAEDAFSLVENMASPRGKVIFDERTNKIFIEDIEEKIFDMEKMIESIDIPVRQVSVEARIVYAKKSAKEEMGVRWTSGVDTTYSNTITDNIGIGEGSSLGSLGGAASTVGITLGFINANIDATLNALETNGDVEIVARPTVIAADKQQSVIASGQEYPYLEISDDGDVTTVFKEILLSLDVTPQITPDDTLILDLAIVQDSIAEITESGPALDTTKINSRVIVDNMETLVLGGVFKEDTIEGEEKVPLLGDIPLLGDAFKYKNESKEKVELLIFITPKILDGEKIINR